MRLDDVPSLVLGPFGWLSHMAVVMLRASEDSSAVRAALSSLAPETAFGTPERTERALQVAFTPRGLRRLGLTEATLATFPRTFTLAVEDEHRLRALGDRGASGPANWSWSGDRIDVVLFLYAGSEEALLERIRGFEARIAPAFTVEYTLRTAVLDRGREHFGFRDGLSQPAYEGLIDGADPLAPGEVLLGHPDESGSIPASPRDGAFDLGLDGTYVVLRQLEQDVAGFWEAMRARATDDEDPVALAAKLIGRWPDGTPVGREGTGVSPRAPLTYADDRRGLFCPKGAHIRRAHPRDAMHEDPAVSLAMTRRHRLLRRGRPYGPPAPPEFFPPGVDVTRGMDRGLADEQRGLVFVCLGTDLARQFEHVQQTWLNNTKHDGLHDEACPITSGRELTADARRYTLPGRPLRQRSGDLPHFVRVRGSAYLFLPGRRALEHLGSPS